MSKVLEAQIADAEASTAETGGDGDGDGDGDEELGAAPADEEEAEDEDETAAEEGETAPDTSPSQQAIIRQLEGEHTRHRKALTKVLGEGFAQYEECPTCFAMGYVASSPLRQDTKVRKCDHCDGYGQVLTGALPPGEAIRQCPDCLGNGHVPASEVTAPVFQFSATGVTTSPSNAPTVPPEVARLREMGYVVVEPMASAG